MLKRFAPLLHFVSYRFTPLNFHRYQTTLSSPKSNSSNGENNEWLWEYLRHRQTYQLLTDEQKRQVIQLEIQTLRESGERVPDEVPEDFWPQLISAPLLNSRKSIYNYLFVREVSKRKRSAEKAALQERRQRSSERQAQLAAQGLPLSNYPGYKSMFRQLTGGHTERWLRDTKLMAQARLNDQILVDCGFEITHARSKYVVKLVDQLEFFFSDIDEYHSPSFVTLCNLAIDGQIQQEFNRRANQNRAISCFEMTESNYLDLYNRDQLIYLSPHSPYEMSEYDHNAVYIVGAIVDASVSGRPLTLAKAKRDNIRHQKLPLERYLKFGSNASRTLSLDKIYSILMALKHGRTWSEAFEAIPDRIVTQRFDQPRWNRKESITLNKSNGFRREIIQ